MRRPLSDKTYVEPDLEISYTFNGLQLSLPAHPEIGSISADFCNSTFKYRIEHGGGRKQALGRAVGLKPNYSPHIFDATAGLGRDAIILSSLGCQVTCCERSPVIHALLSDGILRAAKDPELEEYVSRLTIHNGNSLVLLSHLSLEQDPEVIYLDPMFPHRTKSALVKKEMRCLRILAGEDTDSYLLLKKALECATNRVVCKRPLQSEPIEGPKPHFSIKTKKHRFDIYLTELTR